MVVNESLVAFEMSETLTSMMAIMIGLVVLLPVLGIIIKILTGIGRNDEESEAEIIEVVETEEESDEEDFEDNESEELEIFQNKEVFHKVKTEEKPKVDIPESKMTEKDFNRSEFD